MPKKWFQFKDGSTELIENVLAGKSDKARRYAPLSYYQRIAEDRKFKGTIGVTSLQKGARQWYLEHLVDYAVNVDQSVYMILGIGTHAELEKEENNLLFPEQWVQFEEVRGRYDLIERNPDTGELTMSDTKVLGSFGVAKKLGIEKGDRKPVFDENGNPVLYQRNTKYNKTGDQKTEASFRLNPEKADIKDVQQQLNCYRVMYELQGGPKIDIMKAFLIVRDGGLISAKQRGVMDRKYFPVVPFMDDEQVIEWMRSRKNERLLLMKQSEDLIGKALPADEFISEAKKLEVLPPLCSYDEAWGGRKCRTSCGVAYACKMAGDNKYLGGNVEDQELEDF